MVPHSIHWLFIQSISLYFKRQSYKSCMTIIIRLMNGDLIVYSSHLFVQTQPRWLTDLRRRCCSFLAAPERCNMLIADGGCCTWSLSGALKPRVLSGQYLTRVCACVRDEKCNPAALASMHCIKRWQKGAGGGKELVRNNLPRRWQCPLSGIWGWTCLRG